MRKVIIFLLITPFIIIPGCGISKARIQANEGSAIGRLRSLSTSQVMFQQQALVDQDQDGTGEYGFLQELAGGKSRGTISDPSLIDSKMGAANNGVVTKNGYHFCVYLPGKDAPLSGLDSEIKAIEDANIIDRQEQLFVIYAWPVKYGTTGKRVFVVNQTGDVLAADNAKGRYSGDNKPTADAAYSEPSPNLEGEIRKGKGNDGETWGSAM